MEVKIRIPKYTGFCCSSRWILNLLVNVHVAIKVHGLSNTKNVSLGKVYEYCSEPTPDKITSSLLARIIFFIVFLCLMVWASGSMILVLHRHKQQVQHIHSNSLSLRPSHEARATGTIPILVSFFVLLYSLSSILTFCVVVSVNPAQWLVNTSVFVALCFPTLSSFVLITHDTRVSKLRFVKIAFFFIGCNMSSTGH
ncbi:LOW QUALITY PROTEIN: vomeronasal type-1 receptor 1-like [Phocoena phocoena]|uniref:LOW QUALITY PROTEIN: vomeronasal type-1 receptor 1-like n=1 Tax=Phocoena phocoena TaxID=9742 RepID=UPI00330769E0